MVVFDAHCDTLQKITDFGGNVFKNPYHFDITRVLQQELDFVQVFAAFIDREKDRPMSFNRCSDLINTYYKQINRFCDKIMHCNSANDIEIALKSNKTAALLSIEGGDAIEGSLDNLYHFFNRGVRIMTLCWNYDNEICGGIEGSGKGLTDFGINIVKKMNTLGMTIDVSHGSEKTFWDVLDETKSPIIASHSNAKKICNHKRNLNDKQITAIIENGGCIGINFCPEFVSENKCDVSDILKHIEHILGLGGKNNIGIGSDFDGVESLPQGIDGVQNICVLADEMRRIGYSELLINKLYSGNFLNVMKKNLIS